MIMTSTMHPTASAPPPSFASFDNAKEGDTVFLLDNDPATAITKVKQCKASKIYISQEIANRLIRTNQYPRPHTMIIACKNPRLEFIKELTANTIDDKVSFIGWHSTLTDTEWDGTSPPIVGDNSSIGTEALATERDENGKIWRFPHIGTVQIGKNVWIGSNVNISRGVLSDTIIEDNVTIDDHVHIAHNCRIGKNSMLTAGATFGGSVKTGHDCWFGLNCTINDHVHIGNNVLVASGAVVVNDVPDMDMVRGVPAKSFKDKSNLTAERRYHMVGY